MKFFRALYPVGNDELSAASIFFFSCNTGASAPLRLLEGETTAPGKKIAGLVTDVAFDSRIIQAPFMFRYSVAGNGSDPDQRLAGLP